MLYLMQVLIYTAAMLLIYGLLLRNRPIYQFSRFYLLASAVLPIFIPLVQLPATIQRQVENATGLQSALPAITISVAGKIAGAPKNIPLFWLAYVLVALLFVARQLWHGYALRQLIRRNKKEDFGAYTIVSSSGQGPGSFGRYIFIPGDEINKTILAHERAHIRLRHSGDLVFLSILQSVLWPNLLLIWIIREIKEVHEFQADALVNADSDSYTQLLLSSTFDTHVVPVMHSFAAHPLKRRILMLQKNGQPAPLKTVGHVVVALGLFFFTAICIQGCNKNPGSKSALLQAPVADEKATGAGTASGSPVYSYVDRMPRSSTDLSSFLQQNLHYPQSAREKGIEGKVIVRFIVDEQGNVVHPVILGSPDSSLSNETIRVTKLMPAWIPGENNGKPVQVYFTLPVLFSLGNQTHRK